MTTRIESQSTDEAADHGQSLAAAKAELDGVKSELALLSSRLETKDAEVGEHGRSLSSKQAELDGVRAELELLTDRLEIKRHDEAEHARLLSEAQAELEGAKAELVRLTTDHETIRAANAEEAQRVQAAAETRIAEAVEASEQTHRSHQDAWQTERTALEARISSFEDEARREAERRLAEERPAWRRRARANGLQNSLGVVQARFDLERQELSAETAALRAANGAAISDRDARSGSSRRLGRSWPRWRRIGPSARSDHHENGRRAAARRGEPAHP